MVPQNLATIEQTARRLNEATTIALVLPHTLSVTTIGSATAFTRALRKLEKAVTVFSPPLAALPLKELAPWQELGSENEPLREFVISFDLTRSPIRELKYERDQNRLNIILSPTNSRIRKEDVEFKYGPLRYDLVVTLGVPRLADAEGSVATVPELLHEKPVVNIDASPLNDRYGEVNLVDTKATLPEIIYELLERMNAPALEAESATPLLAALADATNGFGPDTRADAFFIAGTLLKRGADALTVRRYRPHGGYSLVVEKLAARAVIRSRIDLETSTLWSLLTKEDLVKTTSDRTAIRTALERVAASLPGHQRYILLLQSPSDDMITGLLMFSSPEERSVFESAPGFEREGDHVSLREPASTFLAAEEKISQLLASRNQVE